MQNINSVMRRYDIPDLHSAITLFINNQDSGARPHRDDYRREHLPPSFECLDVWSHMHFRRPRINEFYAHEVRQLRCKPANKDSRVIFDPIVVELSSARSSTPGMADDDTIIDSLLNR